MALTFREYSSNILLVLFVFGTAGVFSGSMITQYDAKITGSNNDTVNKLNSKLSTIKPDVAETKKDAANASPGSGVGFVGTTFATIGNVLAGIGLLPTLGNILINKMGFTDQILLLLAIPAVAIIWEAISVYNAMRT